MKKRFLLLILCIIAFPLIGNALVKPSNSVYVTDEAKVLKKDTKDYISQCSDFLSRTKEIRFFVVTVPYLENYELEYYADYVFDSFHMGDKGVLVFFSKEENAVQIILGSKVTETMTDDELEMYINDYFLSYFKNVEWDKGIRNGYSALYKKICDYYKIDASELKSINGNSFLVKYRYSILTGLIIFGMICGYIFCSFFKKMYLHRLKTIFEYILFCIIFIINILLLAFSYYLEPWSLIMVLGVEIFTIVTVFDTTNNMTLEEALIKIRKDEAKKRARARRREAQSKRRVSFKKQPKNGKKRKTV